MASDDLIVIRTFTAAIDVALARSALEAAGIESTSSGDDMGGMRPHLSFDRQIRLLVRSEDAERAREVLDSPAARA